MIKPVVIETFKAKLSECLKNLYIIKILALNFIDSVKKIFNYTENDRAQIRQNIIYVAGGHGYGNAGNEAICEETLKSLTEKYPSFEVINLTPDVEYSKTLHPDFCHEKSSQVLFFNYRTQLDYFFCEYSLIKKVLFLIKSVIVYVNAYLVRANLPTVLINVETAKFLYDLHKSSLFYFSGGGYLTGNTPSKLWDGILLCKIMDVFRVPVVISGQTIGFWQNPFNKYLAKWGFKNVKVIAVRDGENSLEDLKEIDLSGENYFSSYDDALFCEKAETKQLSYKKYIAIHFHRFDMDEATKEFYFERINKIIDFCSKNTNYRLVFIPMTLSDMDSFNDYTQTYPNSKLTAFEYDYDFRKARRVIADSKMCITMRHQPIIFAMGENVPTISLNVSDYYIRKNKGTMVQYGQGRYCVNLQEDEFLEDFILRFQNILANYDSIKAEIGAKKEDLKLRKERFWEMVDKTFA